MDIFPIRYDGKAWGDRAFIPDRFSRNWEKGKKDGFASH
ncbi:hypothetical protein B4135_3491 [Caldibacillus debilis]|uniref:Uncharacterized protein n=1 Tax=Caldibacillus debilis TaxID=301148 RepID=A0A150LEC7_9BACI|nr:hypothetical protein B4135_3491 [Caldibacillus debilis]